MITKEVNDWIRKVEMGQYSYDDAMYEFVRFSKYLTQYELVKIKKILEKSYS